ncbi:hypothetical protein LCGC14_2189540 [marine sediment metagenome]|uniref:Uncharacterized protein n=1 Tax=marine sediment metagenome TaxID=412755 RepID=A0A0F9FXB2_9ZZZZ
MSYDLLFAIGWIAAALMAGLWWGERGRRVAAERWAITGSPNAPHATSMAPSKEAEDRFAESVLEYSEESVDRGVKQMMADAEAAGVSLNEADARRDVKIMLSGEDALGL